MEKTTYNSRFVIGITLVAAMGGLLFGYDWVVIGGAKPFYERFFEITLSPHLQGWAMSSALVGCLAGAWGSGYLSDRYGRKKNLILAAALFTLSAIGTGAADGYLFFTVYRLLGGVGIGIASALSPVYIAEIAPAAWRGRLVAINQLTIVTGILAAQIINYLIAEKVPAGATDLEILNSWNGQTGWRIMFWAEVVPAVAFFLLAFMIPESPRFLAKTGKWQPSQKILEKIGGFAYAQSEGIQIRKTLEEASSRVDWTALTTKKTRPVLVLGLFLAVFQQWCGINVIFNYAEEIFTSAGYTVSEMLLNIIITGTVNLVFTLAAIRMVDSWGRRKLMIVGSAGLAIIYLLVGTSYATGVKGMALLLLVLAAIAIYAMTLAPVTWVILSEIFPNRIRGAGMAMATTALWAACFVLTYTFPLLNKLLNASGTFWLYALICLLGFVFILKKLPETKGRSLEEIEQTLLRDAVEFPDGFEHGHNI